MYVYCSGRLGGGGRGGMVGRVVWIKRTKVKKNSGEQVKSVRTERDNFGGTRTPARAAKIVRTARVSFIRVRKR